MSVVINTNSDALRIQSTLTSATNKLSSTMQRMSSGLKINSAKDDAAGTVIAARMNVQIDGNKIAQQNVQNASSLLSTAEGNIDVVLDNITRIRDLTLQAKNGTYSPDEIAAMQDEVAQRIAEIDRVSESAKFSQLDLFGGSLATEGISFQVGTNATANDVIKADKDLFASVKFNDVLSGDVASLVRTTAITNANYAGAFETGSLPEITTGASGNIGKVAYDTTAGKFKIASMDASGEKAWVEYEGNVSFEVKNTGADVDDGTEGKLAKIKQDDGSYAYYRYNSAGEEHHKWVQLTGYKGEDVAEKAVYSDSNKFDLKTMDTEDKFKAAINALDKAVDNLTSRKSLIGSLGNRLDSAFDTLTTQQANLASAKSIITDADIASEAAAYTQNQILQQVSTSLLAQANQAPSIALSLL